MLDLEVVATSGAVILDSVSLTVARGEIVALVGESGSGKTSLGLALLGFARPGTRINHGTVALGGQDILSLPRGDVRQLRGSRISYVPQDPTASLDPRQRIRNQVREMLEEHHQQNAQLPKDRIVETVLSQVGLSDEQGNRYPFELSGGQQQRAAIAMSLSCQPDFVVFDEPTTGLDVTTQRRILDLIRGLVHTTGAGFIYITHDLAVVHDLADRVAVMYAGRIVEEAGKRQLFGSPRHPYSAQLINSAPEFGSQRRLQGISGTAPPVGARPPGCSFAPRCKLRIEDCERQPPVRQLQPGHFVRCHILENIEMDRGAPALRKDMNGFDKKPVLEVRSLQASHGHRKDRRRIIDSVSFNLFPGECIAVVGESGSGKTTLGRSIVGLHVADSGKLTFRGASFSLALRDRPHDVRRGIQMIFQNPDRCLNPVHSISDIINRSIRLAQRQQGTDRSESIADLLDRVGLPRAIMRRYPRELSGGEKQRVAIAAALALRPAVLVCDEVTSALDVSVQATVVNLLDELRRSGMSLLFITHNLALVSSIADKILVLQNGQVCEEGKVRDVLGNPKQAYTQNLISDLPQMNVLAKALR